MISHTTTEVPSYQNPYQSDAFGIVLSGTIFVVVLVAVILHLFECRTRERKKQERAKRREAHRLRRLEKQNIDE